MPLLLIPFFVAAASPALRLILQQGPSIGPREPSTPRACTSIQVAGCYGGAAEVGAWFRALRSEARLSVTLTGHDESTIAKFHPKDRVYHAEYWKRIGADVGLLQTPFQTQPTADNDTMRWFTESNIPILSSGWKEGNESRSLMFSMVVRHAVIVERGPWKIGLIFPLGPFIYIPWVDLGSMVSLTTAQLRRMGADIIVGISAYDIAYWGSVSLWQYRDLIDVVIPPDGSSYPSGNQIIKEGRSYLLPPGRTGSSLEAMGVGINYVDFEVEDGRLVPVASRNIDLRDPLPPELKDARYEEDAQWLDKQLRMISLADPPIAIASSPMPSNRVLNSRDDGPLVVDERCRRGPCELGVFLTDVMLEETGVDIAFVNGGGMQYGWPAGNVSVRDVWVGFPWQNTVCTFRVSGLDLFRNVKRYVDYLTSTGGWNGTISNTGGFVQASGMRYFYDASRAPEDNRMVSMEWFDPNQGWVPLEGARFYTVASHSFVCGENEGFSFPSAKDKTVSQRDIQSILIETLRSRGTFQSPTLHGGLQMSATATFNLRAYTLEECTAEGGLFEPEFEQCISCPPGSSLKDGVCETSTKAIPMWLPIVIVASFVCVAVPVGWRYTANWRRMRQLHSSNAIAISCAQSIASLRLEEVDYIRNIPQPNQLQRSFIQIIDHLVQYRSFLPQSVEDQRQMHDARNVQPPSEGEVTIVFTDIQNSTMLWEKLGDHMMFALDAHNRVLRSWGARLDGYEVKTIGDAFMLAFSEPTHALEFCLGSQDTLLDVELPHEFESFPVTETRWDKGKRIWGGLRVRMGVHCGPCLMEKNPVTGRFDYRGSTVNRAARCEALGMGGVATLSLDAHNRVQARKYDVRGGDFYWKSCGAVAMRGFDAATEIFMYSTLRLAARCDPTNQDLKDGNTPNAGTNPLRRRADSRVSSVCSSRNNSPLLSLHTPNACEPILSSTLGHIDTHISMITGVAPLPHLSAQSVARFNDLAVGCIETMKRTNGSIVSVSGLSLQVGWNVSMPCDSHELQALRFAAILPSRHPGYGDFTLGVVSGPTWRGDVGTSTRMHSVVLGNPVFVAKLVAEAAWEMQTTCLAATLTESRLLHSYGRVVDVWGMKTGGRLQAIRVIEPLPFLAASISPEALWASPPTFDAEVSLVERCLRGDENAIEEFKKQDKDEVLEQVWALLQSHVAKAPEKRKPYRRFVGGFANRRSLSPTESVKDDKDGESFTNASFSQTTDVL
eukprot:Hpha_TRINITY_DN9990_c0_g1::TRINITY_DN9990_c0_g1_i1::g.140416::m.140416